MLIALLLGQIISIATCLACVFYCAKQVRCARRCHIQVQQAIGTMAAMHAQTLPTPAVLPSTVMQDAGYTYNR